MLNNILYIINSFLDPFFFKQNSFQNENFRDQKHMAWSKGVLYIYIQEKEARI